MKSLLTYSSVTILAVFTFCLMAETADAQSRHYTHQNMGLGGGGTAYQGTYHANFINPANLMLDDHRRPRLSVGLFGGLYTQAGGDLLNIQTYNEYLTTGMVLEGQLADDMLNQWFGRNSAGMRSLSSEIGIVPFGFSWRSENSAFSVVSRGRVMQSSRFSRGFADLFFKGLDAEVFADGRNVSMDQEVVAFHEVSAGYSRLVMERDAMLGFGRNVRLYAGVAPKMMFAQAYTNANLTSVLTIREATEDENSYINHVFDYSINAVGEFSNNLAAYNEQRDLGNSPPIGDYLDIDGSDFSSVKGTSLGFDLGLTLEMDVDEISAFDFGIFKGPKKLRVAASITDLGSLKFSDNARSFRAANDFTWRGFNYDRELIDEEFDGDSDKYFESVLADSIGSDVYGNFVTEDRSDFSVGLPTMFNIGTHLLLGKFSVMADFGKGFVERGNNSSRLYMALGTEYRLLNRIPLRVGYRTGGYSSSTYHFGTGLEFRNFEFSVAAGTTNSSEKRGGSLGFAWSGLVFHF